jgi:hypothetical protein
LRHSLQLPLCSSSTNLTTPAASYNFCHFTKTRYFSFHDPSSVGINPKLEHLSLNRVSRLVISSAGVETFLLLPLAGLICCKHAMWPVVFPKAQSLILCQLRFWTLVVADRQPVRLHPRSGGFLLTCSVSLAFGLRSSIFNQSISLSIIHSTVSSI